MAGFSTLFTSMPQKLESMAVSMRFCDSRLVACCTAFSRSAFTFCQSLLAAVPPFTIEASLRSLPPNSSCRSRFSRSCSSSSKSEKYISFTRLRTW